MQILITVGLDFRGSGKVLQDGARGKLQVGRLAPATQCSQMARPTSEPQFPTPIRTVLCFTDLALDC